MDRIECTYPVGERINYFREIKGISTNKLALDSGISQAYLRDIQLGNKCPTVEILARVCETLDLSLSQFFSESTDTTFNEDPLIKKIYRLSDKQRDALSAFLDTIEIP